jgi:hypothetical protein
MILALSSSRDSQDRYLFHDLRILASGCAVLLASLICHNLGHFTLILSEPSTWHLATQHRCDWVLIAAAAWFLAETITRIYTTVSAPRKPSRFK